MNNNSGGGAVTPQATFSLAPGDGRTKDVSSTSTAVHQQQPIMPTVAANGTSSGGATLVMDYNDDFPELPPTSNGAPGGGHKVANAWGVKPKSIRSSNVSVVRVCDYTQS